ncbi:MAG: LPS export ABC transporter periplasmic protein LptC [Gemmatimonadota bacterium]
MLLSALTGLGLVAVLGCADQGVRPSASTALRDSADQLLIKMETGIFAPDGARKSFVTADTAYVYQASQRMDLRQMRALFFNSEGKQTSVLTAKMGLYTITTGTLDARGNVVVVGNDGRRLMTEHLIYDKTLNQIRSDTNFVYDSKDGHLTGGNFKSDPDFKNVDVHQPKGFERGQGRLLPGQEEIKSPSPPTPEAKDTTVKKADVKDTSVKQADAKDTTARKTEPKDTSTNKAKPPAGTGRPPHD